LCRSCGHEVTNADDIVKIPSLLAKQVRNDTILGVPGVLIQLFENPQGMFDLWSVRKCIRGLAIIALYKSAIDINIDIRLE